MKPRANFSDCGLLIADCGLRFQIRNPKSEIRNQRTPRRFALICTLAAIAICCLAPPDAFAQRPRRLTIIARTTGDPAAAIAAFQAGIDEIDPTADVRIGTLRDAASTELEMRRVGTQMAGAIGIVGLLLTGIGLYGVLSYLVASRTAELGIRMVLGATARRLHREVLGHAGRLVGGGIAIGAAVSFLITPALATFLAGLSPADPIAFLAAAGVLAIVAFVASYLPARRVSRVDPVVALRE